MIYTNGCSYTFGIGCSQHDSAENCKKYCWPTKLSELLDDKVINEAIPGSSNLRIARDSLTALAKDDFKIAVIMWSDIHRTELFRPGEGEYRQISMAQITPQNVNNIKSFYHKEAFEGYYGFINSEERALLESLTLMLGVNAMAKAKNIPLINLHFKRNFNRYFRHVLMRAEKMKDETHKTFIGDVNKLKDAILETNNHFFGFDSEYGSFEWLFKKNDLPYSKYSLGHPGREAHEEMAKWIYNYIIENDLVS